MKIKVVAGYSDYAPWDELFINGKQVYNSHPLCECPEDAILGRSLTGADEITEWLKAAHAAGKAGEPFEIEHEGSYEEQ